MKILIEGLDCAGKTTLLNGLAERLKTAGFDGCRINLGGLTHGAVDRLAQSMYRLKWKNRYLLNMVFALVPIVDRLFYKHHGIVLQDSYCDRMIAYQQTFGIRVIPSLMKKIAPRLTEFDLVLYLGVDLPVRVERMRQRKNNNVNDSLMVNRPKEFMELECRLLERIIKRPNYHYLDTTNLTKEQVLDFAFELLSGRLRGGSKHAHFD